MAHKKVENKGRKRKQPIPAPRVIPTGKQREASRRARKQLTRQETYGIL